ncbi:RNA polymerase III-inhibiting protein maf1 [Podochytrium sp. JEL0797]|nr:RNA polymerase III-inhibiting protein maf1 [Podochytrium sp. JEL0797]
MPNCPTDYLFSRVKIRDSAPVQESPGPPPLTSQVHPARLLFHHLCPMLVCAKQFHFQKLHTRLQPANRVLRTSKSQQSVFAPRIQQLLITEVDLDRKSPSGEVLGLPEGTAFLEALCVRHNVDCSGPAARAFGENNMKYLEYNSLEEINTALSSLETSDTRVFSRLDAYSCKTTTDDRKLKMHIDEKYESSSDQDTILSTSAGAPSPFQNGPISHSPVSPYGPLAQVSLSSRKTLFYLLGTLNAAFPDYDFSDIKPELFVKIPNLGIAQRAVACTLFMGLDGVAQHVSQRLWEAIDEVIQLQEADIYSFNPDPEMEPDSEEGNL